MLRHVSEFSSPLRVVFKKLGVHTKAGNSLSCRQTSIRDLLTSLTGRYLAGIGNGRDTRCWAAAPHTSM